MNFDLQKVDRFFERSRTYKNALLSIFLIASGFRICRLFITGPVSFDEAYTTWVGSKGIFSLFSIAAVDKHPPLYYLFMHFWNIPGYSELWIRVPSLIASIASLYVFIKIAEQFLNSRLAVVSAFLLFAVDVSQIHYTSIARSYAIDSVFVMISVYSFFKILSGGEAKKWFWLNLISNIVLILLVYTGGFVFIAQALTIILIVAFFPDNKKLTLRWIKFHLGMLVVGLIMIPYVYNQLSVGGFAPKWIAEIVGEPYRDALFFQGTLLNLRLFRIDSFEFRLLVGTFIAILIFMAALSKKARFKINSDLKFWTLIFTYAIPPVVFWLISKIEPIFVSRYFLMFYFAYYLILTYALFNLSYVKRVAPVLVLLFFAGVIPLIEALYTDLYKESDWRTKSAIIADNWNSDDVIFVVPHADGLRVKFYLREMSKYKIDLDMYRSIFRSKSDHTTTAILDSTFMDWKYPYKRIWFHEEKETGLAAEFKVVQKEGFIYNYLDSLYTRVEQLDFDDEHGNLALFELTRKK